MAHKEMNNFEKGVFIVAGGIALWILEAVLMALGDVHLFGKRKLTAEPPDPVVIGRPNGPDQKLVGQSGVTQTRLNPSGFVVVQGKRQQAVSEGEFLDLDTAVTVVKIRENNVVVRKVDEPSG